MVADSGCGVSSDDKEKLFLPYFSTKDRGTGLGLAIVSHIVAEHNAQIRVEDNQPVGARFTIEIPAVVENERRGASSGPRGVSGMKQHRVLVVDDEPAIRQSLSGVLEDEGYIVESAESGEACLAALPGRRLRTGAAGYLAARHGWHGSARAHSGDPVRRTPRGGRDQRPRLHRSRREGHQIGRVRFPRKAALHRKGRGGHQERDRRSGGLQIENSRLKQDTGSRWRIIGESVPMKALRQQLCLMAGTNGRVLIYGESGTGKELVAHALHALSPRAAEPFVEVNCAAIPEELIESEMFGHIKGSFTSAHEDKIGKFQKADGGTLFLDEVGDMSLRTQSKVLRALEEQRFEPVGAPQSVQVDVRVVAATNKNLEEEIERGNFREDLFYRLNVIPFFVPPLRDRREDIPQLADHFLREFTTAYGRKPKELTPEAYRILIEYHWPGNVRELRNLIERIVILNPQVRVDARHIPLQGDAPPARPAARPLRQPAGSPRGSRARVHSQEARGDQRQRDAHRRIARPGAQQSIPQDEDAGYRPERIVNNILLTMA